MNLESKDFRTYRIRVYEAGEIVFSIEKPLYIYYPKNGSDNYSVHFVDADNKHTTIYANTIIVEEV